MTVLVRLPLIGDGSPAAPFGVNLPTYTLLEADYDAKTALVEVQEADIPATLHNAAGVVLTRTAGRAIVTRMPVPVRLAWSAHLDRRYGGVPGRFTPEPR